LYLMDRKTLKVVPMPGQEILHEFSRLRLATHQIQTASNSLWKSSKGLDLLSE